MTDPFLDFTTCSDRLFKEWEKHKKLIVALDFDDTVYDWRGSGDTHDKVLDLVRSCKALGFYIVMFTASKADRYDFIRTYMKEKGIEVDSINKNPIDLPYGNDGKIYYNILLCDRAGLKTSYLILKGLVNRINTLTRTKNRVYLEAPRYLQPAEYECLDTTVFLAGSITNAVDWQTIAKGLLENDFHVFNPRRDSFDVTSPSEELTQITWEHDHLERADIVLFWFSNETLAPTTLYELGKYCTGKTIVVGTHPEYKRRRVVEIQLKLVGYNQPIHTTIEDVCAAVKQLKFS